MKVVKLPLLLLSFLLLSLPVVIWASRTQKQEIRKEAEAPETPASKQISEILPLNITGPISKLSLDGTIYLPKPESFLRIILVDKQENEYLVYEAYPLITGSGTLLLDNACEETCALDVVFPQSLRVEGFAADFKIEAIHHDPGFLAQGPVQTAAQKETEKIKKLNENIKAKGLRWVAGETPISKLSYAEKKKLFTEPDGSPVDQLPNLQGFEYYKGGVFEIASEENFLASAQQTDSNLPESWDWRNVHGENWNTPVKNQGSAGTCWAHGKIGALESQINLYFNQHVDVDLSEQMLVDCVNKYELPLGMTSSLYEECSGLNWVNNCYPGSDFCVISYHGIADEACDAYVQRDLDSTGSYCKADYICSDWQDRIWKIAGFHDYKFSDHFGAPTCPHQTMNTSEDEFKKTLIQKGPMYSSHSFPGVSHGMVLSGYSDRSDWRGVEFCSPLELCHPQEGCLSKECQTPNGTLEFCNNTVREEGQFYSAIYTYKCQYYPGRSRYEWRLEKTQTCETGNRCVDNVCKSESYFALNEGHYECANMQYGYGLEYGDSSFMELQGYYPGNGDHYWIFKNSWGENWGEAGYARVAASLDSLGYGSLPLGPITPPNNHSFWPTEFAGQINCVDQDADSYCNWGVSEQKPHTCPSSCRLEKDCDDANAGLGPFDENFNCLALDPTASPSPAPTLTATPTPTSVSPTPLPGVNTMIFKIKLPGITAKPSDRQSLTIKLASYEGQEVKNETIEIVGNDEGSFAGTLTNVLSGSYYAYLKPWAHLRLKINTGIIDEHTPEFGWTNLKFIAGDFDGNNVLNIFDLAALIRQYTDLQVPVTDQNRAYDVNLDGRIDIFDIALVIQGYTDLEVRGD